MPIRVGTRLARLVELRRRIDVEIELEKRAERLRPRGRADEIKPARVPRTLTVTRLGELGVTAAEVKRWAYDMGLIAEITRGPVGGQYVEAYANAHPPDTNTEGSA